MGRLSDGVNDMKGITMGPLPAESQQHMLRKNAPLVSPLMFPTKRDLSIVESHQRDGILQVKVP
jgi:hypothetical protein